MTHRVRPRPFAPALEGGWGCGLFSDGKGRGKAAFAVVAAAAAETTIVVVDSVAVTAATTTAIDVAALDETDVQAGRSPLPQSRWRAWLAQQASLFERRLGRRGVASPTLQNAHSFRRSIYLVIRIYLP